MEETLSLPVNSHCLQDKRVLSPQSGHEPSSNHIYTPNSPQTPYSYYSYYS